MSQVSFACGIKDAYLIDKIAARYMALRERTHQQPVEKLDVVMDITACHCNGTPLRLGDLLHANDFNFAHDMAGIANHINRHTGKIERHFLPRFYDSAADTDGDAA